MSRRGSADRSGGLPAPVFGSEFHYNAIRWLTGKNSGSVSSKPRGTAGKQYISTGNTLVCVHAVADGQTDSFGVIRCD